jgi:hypothetical protein
VKIHDNDGLLFVGDNEIGIAGGFFTDALCEEIVRDVFARETLCEGCAVNDRFGATRRTEDEVDASRVAKRISAVTTLVFEASVSVGEHLSNGGHVQFLFVRVSP